VVRNQTERIQGAHAGLGGDGRVEVELGPGEEVDGGARASGVDSDEEARSGFGLWAERGSWREGAAICSLEPSRRRGRKAIRTGMA